MKRLPRSHRRVLLVLLTGAPGLGGYTAACAVGAVNPMDQRIFAAFMAGICACQAVKWTVIAIREFLRERKAEARALAVLGLKDPQEAER